MAVFRTNFPSGEFAPLFRLFDDYHEHRNTLGDHHTARHHQPALASFSPRFDVREADDAYHLDGELPGVAQKDIDIEFSDSQTLVVKGHTEREYHTGPETQPDATEGESAAAETDKNQASHRFWASERSIGEFQRTFSFPGRVDQNAVKASLKNGILSIVVPKANASASKKITVE